MRKGRAKKRVIQPDFKYNNVLVAKFVNCMMKDGKKNLSYKIFYTAIDKVAKKTKEDGLETWEKALKNAMPVVEVRSRRIGGSNFQIPVEVKEDRKKMLAIKWMVEYARKRKEKTMIDRLTHEIIAASKNEGETIKKKEDVHRMANANKAFSHFRI